MSQERRLNVIVNYSLYLEIRTSCDSYNDIIFDSPKWHITMNIIVKGLWPLSVIGVNSEPTLNRICLRRNVDLSG